MVRNDGRANDALRKITITRNYISHAEGSCLIEVGGTRVICTASVEDTVPPFLRNSGNGWVTAEYGMIPRSCTTRLTRGKNSGRVYEIQRLIGRALRAVTDTKKIGERTVRIDCDVIQADGGTRTSSITGSYIALVDAFAKLRSDGVIKSMPVNDFVVAVSVGIVNSEVVLDLNYEEDSLADVDMNVVMTGSGRFIEIQGAAERKPFSDLEMSQMIESAKKGIKELVLLQRKHLAKVF